MSELYIAVDLGAGSGRVFLAAPDPGEFLLEEISRFQYPPSESDGHLRWNLPKIFNEIKQGLHDAGARASQLGRPIQSIGVDSWGVDYGLIDVDGNLLELPVCYRDKRTQGVIEQVLTRVPREEIFRRIGIQFLPLNTLFQLYAHVQEGIPARARRLLLIPDLINFFLTGKTVTESTNATTTQMVNAHECKWDRDLLNRLQLPANLLPEIIAAGEPVGALSAEIALEIGLEAKAVIAPATHDTGSGFVGAPLRYAWAYIAYVT